MPQGRRRLCCASRLSLPLRSMYLLAGQLLERRGGLGETGAERGEARELCGPPLHKAGWRAARSLPRLSSVPLRARRNRQNSGTCVLRDGAAASARRERGGGRRERWRVPLSLTHGTARQRFRKPRRRAAAPPCFAPAAFDQRPGWASLGTGGSERRGDAATRPAAEVGESPSLGFQDGSYNMGWKGKRTKHESPTLPSLESLKAWKVGRGFESAFCLQNLFRSLPPTALARPALSAADSDPQPRRDAEPKLAVAVRARRRHPARLKLVAVRVRRLRPARRKLVAVRVRRFGRDAFARLGGSWRRFGRDAVARLGGSWWRFGRDAFARLGGSWWRFGRDGSVETPSPGSAEVGGGSGEMPSPGSAEVGGGSGEMPSPVSAEVGGGLGEMPSPGSAEVGGGSGEMPSPVSAEVGGGSGETVRSRRLRLARRKLVAVRVRRFG